MPESMAWVTIDGDKLLAQLQRPHPEGARLTFIVKQLVPDIILKEIFESSAASANALGLASSFDTARTLFENGFRTARKGMSAPLQFDIFLQAIGSNPKLLPLFLDAAGCAQTVSAHLDQSRQGRLLYQPWLTPDGRRQATLVKPSEHSLTEIIMEFEHDAWGLVRAEFLYKSPTISYRLKLQHMTQAQSIEAYMTQRVHPNLAIQPECLGVTKLPQSQHGGLLAELMFRTRQ